MILKFKNNGKVLLEHLKTLSGVVENTADNDEYFIDEQKLSINYQPLWWHLKMLLKPKFDFNKEHYIIEIPNVGKCEKSNVNVKIITVCGSGIVIDRLKDYLNEITTLGDVQGNNAVYYADTSKDITKYFVEYLAEQDLPYVNITWTVPPDIITL